MARTLVLSGLLTLVTVEAELLTLAEAQREPLALSGLGWTTGCDANCCLRLISLNF